jgi:hypothetical protein
MYEAINAVIRRLKLQFTFSATAMEMVAFSLTEYSWFI